MHILQQSRAICWCCWCCTVCQIEQGLHEPTDLKQRAAQAFQRCCRLRREDGWQLPLWASGRARQMPSLKTLCMRRGARTLVSYLPASLPYYSFTYVKHCCRQQLVQHCCSNISKHWQFYVAVSKNLPLLQALVELLPQRRICTGWSSGLDTCAFRGRGVSLASV